MNYFASAVAAVFFLLRGADVRLTLRHSVRMIDATIIYILAVIWQAKQRSFLRSPVKSGSRRRSSVLASTRSSNTAHAVLPAPASAPYAIAVAAASSAVTVQTILALRTLIRLRRSFPGPLAQS